MGRERQDGGLMELYPEAAREAASPKASMWVLRQDSGTSHGGSTEMAIPRMDRPPLERRELVLAFANLISQLLIFFH